MELTTAEMEVIYAALLAISQNGAIIDELDILTDDDWDNIDNALAIVREKVLKK